MTPGLSAVEAWGVGAHIGWATAIANVSFLSFLGVWTALADTTRARRSQEREGVEYHFITRTAFQLDVQDNK